MARAIAFLQLTGAGLAVVLVVLPSDGEVDRLGMLVVALVAVAFAVGLLRAQVRIGSGWSVPIALISTALLGGFTCFGGEMASPFGLLYLVTAATTVWFLAGAQTIVQIGWMAATYVLAFWVSQSPDKPPWPQMSDRDLAFLLVGVVALGAATLLVKMFKRRIVEGDERLAAIVRSSLDAIIGTDRDAVINVWNPGAERLYGYRASDAIGQPVRMLFPPRRRGEDQELLRRLLAGEQIQDFQTERVRKDGSVVNVSLSISPIRNADGWVIGTSSIARDVTSMIRAQREIALQAELLDEVDAAVIVRDEDGVVRYWNRGARQLYGYESNEALGQQLVDLIVPEESRDDVIELGHAAIDGRPTETELDARDKHGRVFPVYLRVRGVPLDGAGGSSCGSLGISVDISARREAEQAIRRRAEEQQEIANLGRLALKGAPLEELSDHAVRIASQVLSADCASLVEHLPDATGFAIRATAGWPDERKGERIAGDARSLSGYVLRSRDPVVVEDWAQERRFSPSAGLLARGVRTSVAVLVGDPGSPYGVLAIHYAQPRATPQDCLSFLSALANVLAEAIQSRNAQEMIRHQALHDGLTGLPNRTLFLDRVAHALARNDRRRQTIAVLFIDLDHFKLVNDSLGHHAGDELLRAIVPRLASVIRPSDTLARLGGDEFAVLCEELPSEVAATRIADHLLSALQQPVVLPGDDRVISASIGIALNTAESTADELLRDADAAMYSAKNAARGRSELFDSQMRARVLGRVRTEAALRAALAHDDEIYVHYQPLVSLRTGTIVGAEALARWRHPDWGPVSPAVFIPVAEDSGLIHELGAHIIRRAARESAAWQHNAGFTGIAINVSTRQLVQPDEVPALIRDAITTEGITPGFLTIEITESLLIEQLDSAQDALRSLKELGIRLALDDFGTGFSSLSYLHDLPFDIVKIDRSLTRKIVDAPRAAALAQAIIHMGHALELKVVAEGVETPEQAARLRALGCDIGQGFHFAKPMAPELLSALLHTRPDWRQRSGKRRRGGATAARAPTMTPHANPNRRNPGHSARNEPST
jgi:diguanylate cyclase (GGDEF)-like protein/PAS domain S-box-containing protein